MLISNNNHHNQAVVEAAYQVIADQGFHSLQLADIATQANVTQTELEACFPTKEALVREVADYMVERFSSTYASASSHTPLDEVRLHFESVRRLLEESPELFVVFAEFNLQSRRDPTTYRIFEEVEEMWFNYLQVLLEEGIDQGQFRASLDVNTTAQMIMVLFIGASVQLRPRLPELDKIITEVEAWLTGK